MGPKSIFAAATALCAFVTQPTLSDGNTGFSRMLSKSTEQAQVAFAEAKSSSRPELRSFLENMPKGGDLHNHLYGAVYAENWIKWAAEDGLCVDKSVPAIRMTPAEGCAAEGLVPASDILHDENAYRELVNAVSLRSYVPSPGWSGHNQFFVTFERMAAKPERFGDMLAEAADRAAGQNILYLELMHTIVLGELFGLMGEGLNMTGDAAHDYKVLMNSSFGEKRDEYVAQIQTAIKEGYARKNQVLNCGTDDARPGCDVDIRLIHQVIRSTPPEVVYAQIALGWEAMKQDDQLVALNLVAPEDGIVALRDYSRHMEMIDYLYKTEGPRNVTLHAGELAMGLVRPDQLKFHIRDAIKLGHAQRIGHGIDIAYEDDRKETLKKMTDDGIMVEINLTSNDVILGIKGYDHPLKMYRKAGVPWALSTDDEGVSRNDLTHEYVKGALEQGLSYLDLKQSSRNALTYSFLNGDNLWGNKDCVDNLADMTKISKSCRKYLKTSEKAQLQWKLEEKFQKFEASQYLQ